MRAPGPRRGGQGSGVVGDFVGDRRHHGGDRQAVYAFAREELDYWAARLGRDIPAGWFGENVTTTGIDVDACLIGERWHIGSAVLEVSGPRVPCRTFEVRMGIRGWMAQFAEHARTGAYLAVLQAGSMRYGDVITVTDRPEHGIDTPTVFHALWGDRDAARRVVDAQVLGADEHDHLVRALRR